MEKSRPEILSEIQETLAALKARIAEIEEKLAVLEHEPEAAPAAEQAEPVPVELPAEEIVDIAGAAPAPPEEAAAAPGPEAAAVPEAETADMPETDLDPIDISLDEIEVDIAPEAPAQAPAVPEAGAAPEAAAAAAPSPAPAPVEPETDPEEELLMEGPAKTNINDRQGRNVRKAVMDVVGQKLAWKTAMPGTPVKNVISAISLNDRVLFINTLFKEDPMAFQEAIAAFNGMASFDEAEEYVRTNYPDWNLNSDLVFRLMMAVRRKLR